MKKGQAALEFVTTYGWMLFILLIVLGVLVSMGFLTPSTPPSCIFPANFVCRGWKLTTDGNLTLDLYQRTNHPIVVRGINCTKAFVETSPTLTATYVFIKNDDHELVANGSNVQCLNEDGSVAVGSIGSTYRGKLLIYYVENDTGVPHLVVGSITARYE